MLGKPLQFPETPICNIDKEKSIATSSFNTTDPTFSDKFQGKQNISGRSWCKSGLIWLWFMSQLLLIYI